MIYKISTSYHREKYGDIRNRRTSSSHESTRNNRKHCENHGASCDRILGRIMYCI
ncbi:MAG: hypothetical protein ACLTXO_14450 [Fusobacterium varium]